MKSGEIWPSSLHLFYVCKCAALKEQIQRHFDNLITDCAAWSPSSVLLTLHHLLIHFVSFCVTGNNVMNHIVLCVVLTGPDEFGYWSLGLLIDSSSSSSHFNPTQPEQTGGGSPTHLSACISGCCSHRSMFAGHPNSVLQTNYNRSQPSLIISLFKTGVSTIRPGAQNQPQSSPHKLSSFSWWSTPPPRRAVHPFIFQKLPVMRSGWAYVAPNDFTSLLQE